MKDHHPQGKKWNKSGKLRSTRKDVVGVSCVFQKHVQEIAKNVTIVRK